jgi:hypothetical protein
MEPENPTTTSKAFNAALTKLVYDADKQGIDLEGGWECRTPAGHPNWDVVILELARGPPRKEE